MLRPGPAMLESCIVAHDSIRIHGAMESLLDQYLHDDVLCGVQRAALRAAGHRVREYGLQGRVVESVVHVNTVFRSPLPLLTTVNSKHVFSLTV